MMPVMQEMECCRLPVFKEMIASSLTQIPFEKAVIVLVWHDLNGWTSFGHINDLAILAPS
jgi:hypothetical protein